LLSPTDDSDVGLRDLDLLWNVNVKSESLMLLGK